MNKPAKNKTKGIARNMRRTGRRIATNAVSIVLTVALAMFGIDPAFAYDTDILIPRADDAASVEPGNLGPANGKTADDADTFGIEVGDGAEAAKSETSDDADATETQSDASVADSDGNADADEAADKTESETDDTETDADASADASASADADADEPEYVTGTIEGRIVTAEGRTFRIEISYDADAEIPEGAKLFVREINQEPSDPDWKDDPAYEGRPLETETFITSKIMKKRLAVMADALELKADEDEAIYYSKLLAVSIKADGKTIKPQAEVEVTIETDEIAKPNEALEAKAKAEAADDAEAAATTETAATAETAEAEVSDVVETSAADDGVAIVDEDAAQTLQVVRYATNKKEAEELDATVDLIEAEDPDSDIAERDWDEIAHTTVTFKTEALAEFGLAAVEHPAQLPEADDEAAATDEAAAEAAAATPAAIEQTLEATDGRVYKIAVTFGPESNIPENAELTVEEIKVLDPRYREYVKESAEQLGEAPRDFAFARAFDITLRDPETDEEFQPDENVKVSIELLHTDFAECADVSVVHFADEADQPEVLDTTVKGETVEFETSGFSVYVVIGHEGETDVVTPRVEFHYIDPGYTENIETVDDGNGTPITNINYTASGYQFYNQKNEKQISQVLRNGESLEQIANPPNKRDTEGHEASFFYGWYTVDMLEDTTGWDSDNSEWTGSITYTWPNPLKVNDRTPITIASGDNPQVGGEVTWSIGEASGTAKLDPEGKAHVYLVPIYEDFYFVNFHMGSKGADSSLKNNLLTRRLVVFGTSESVSTRIGDVMCPSPDSAHQIFSGWETAGDAYYKTVDENQEEVIHPEGKDGYYIDVRKEGGTLKSLDLYPVFAEARWIHYDLGESGNGATYVPSAYKLTNDDNTGTYFNKLSVTSRPGYTFDGWYVYPDGGNIETGVKLTYGASDTGKTAGAFTDDVKGKSFYGVYTTDGEGVKTLTSLSETATTESQKLFEITSDGKLYFYKAIDKLTAHAKWTPQTVNYTVVYWYQNANDDDYTLMYYKVLQGTAGGQTAAQETSSTDTFVRNGTTYYPYQEYKLRFAHLSTDQNKETDGDQGGIQQQTIEGDGSTIVNVYYDRDVYTLRFDIGFARRTSTSGSTTTYEVLSDAEAATYTGTVYGVVDGSVIALTSDGQGGWAYAGAVDVRHDYDGYRYKTTTGTTGTQYGVANANVIELTYSSAQTTEYYLSRYNTVGSAEYTGTIYDANSNEVTNPVYPTTYYRRTRTRDQLYWLSRTVTTEAWTYNGGTPYSGTRYLRVENGSADTSYTFGFVDGSMQTVLRDEQGWYYNTQEPSAVTYKGTLYKMNTVSGTWTYSVSNITGPNYANNDNWDSWLTEKRYDLGTANPFSPEEYTGTYSVVEGGTTYVIFYYEITGKYGENILSSYPGSQPSRKNGNNTYNFVGWLAQRDSYYNARLSTSIKGFFETISEDLILTGGVIPGWNVKDPNADINKYRAVTVDEDNTVTGEHGITQEFRCRYRGGSGYNYLYRIYLADKDTREYPNEPTSKYIITAGSGSNPNLQTPPTYTGYTLAEAKVLSSTGAEQTPGDNYSAYSVPELTAAGVGNGMIMVFRLQPNKHFVSYKYGSGAPAELVNTEISSVAAPYYYGQSLANANIYQAQAEAATPDGYDFAGWYDNEDGVGSRFNFNSTMPDGDIVLYAVYKPKEFLIRINPNGAEIDHIDHTGDAYARSLTTDHPVHQLNRTEVTYQEGGTTVVERPADSGYSKDKSTYFFADYGEPVGEYALSRSYVPISDTAAEGYIESGRRVYAYVNTQYLGGTIDGVWGVPQDLRNALYVDATYGTGETRSDDPTQETELFKLYKFYNDLIAYEYSIRPAGWWDCDGAKDLSFEAWKNLFVAKQEGSSDPQLYRKCNSKETWVFLGWFKVGESMPYNFSDPVEGSFDLEARWRLDGGYTIQYTPEYYMGNGDVINGSIESWIDPESGSAQLSYTDGARTKIFKQPTDLTRNGAAVTDDSLIFLGWRIVSVSNVYDTDGTTILSTRYTPLEDGVYYDPGDDYTVDVQYADSNNVIHMQAVYQDKSSSVRRPAITNLVLDANSGYLTAGSTATTTVTEQLETDQPLPWSGVGTAVLDAEYDRAVFGDFQSNEAVHLYRYASTITEDAKGNSLTDACNYFSHQLGHFLLGFDDGPNEGDYIATYPADGVVSVQRTDNETLYAVWEPMVYMTFKNEADGPVTFGLSARDSSALQVINVKTGMFDREPISNYSSITLPAGEELKLAFPNGAEKDVVISGVNNLGVGKALIWNSSLALVEGNATTHYGTTTGGQSVTYSHTVEGVPHSHDLVTGEARNTKEFEFTERLITNSEPVTVTFSAKNYEYALLLKDNWNGDGTGGGTQEYDYSLDEILPDEGVAKTKELPKTSTRPMYEFLGWAYSATATEPNFSATKPDGSPWTIADLQEFFSEGTYLVGEEPDQTTARDLYAVWKYEEAASHVYIYKDVPEPGNQEKEFTFTVNIKGTYRYNYVNNQDLTEYISAAGTFTLAHGEHADLHSTNSIKNTGYIQTEVTLYGADGERKKDEQGNVLAPIIIKAQASNQEVNNYGTFNNTEHISVVETSETYYTTTITRNSQVDNSYPIYVGNSTDTTTNPLKDVSGSSIEWETTEAGGTVMFTNTRSTKDITVKKELITNGNGIAIFNFSASYTVDGKTKTLDDFTVTSGTPNTEALKGIPEGAELTITEAEDDNYDTTVKVGSGNAVDGRTTSFDVSDDVTVLFTNTLKSYPVKFIKVDQDGAAGAVEAFFKLDAATPSAYNLGMNLPANSTNRGVFYTSGGTKEPLYAGYAYTLDETWVHSGYEGLEGPVTIAVSGTAGNEFTFKDAQGNEISEVWATFNSSDSVWEIRVKNQEVKNITVRKVLSDPLVNQREFTFTGSYTLNGVEYGLDGKAYNSANPYSFVMTPTTARPATKVLTVPVKATNLIVSEDTGLKVDASSTDTFAQTYDTTVALNSQDAVAGSSQTINMVTEDATITFTNARKTVEITVRKTLMDETSPAAVDDPTHEYDFEFVVTVLQGAIPIKNYTVYEGTSADPSDDWVTDENGVVKKPRGEKFVLRHNESQTVKIPVGADVTVKEALTNAQRNKYAVFITMPGGNDNLASGADSTFQLKGPTEPKTIRVFNIPAICKVTDQFSNILYRRVADEGGDIYIPAIHGTINGAFVGINANSLYAKTGSGASAGYSPYSNENLLQVQMLTDYAVPNDDVVTVNAGLKLTFTTAARESVDGYIFRSARPVENPPDGIDVAADDYRAILTRVAGSTKAFFAVGAENASATTFTMSDLIIDGNGAQLESNVKGGCLTAYNSDATIDHCVVYDFVAKQGGAVYTTGNSLTVTDSVFDSCVSELGGDGNGGGAINTTATTLAITGTNPGDTVFKNCSAVFQGGAVYQHGNVVNGRIDDAGKNKSATISNSSFIDCTSRAGGGVEADVATVTVSDCTFTNCTAVKTNSGGNGGGLNNYTTDFSASLSTLTVERSTFQGCTATEYGGGMRGMASTVTVTGCAFEDASSVAGGQSTVAHCQAKNGGGAAFDNAASVVTVSGSTFADCRAVGGNGGGIYSVANSLTVQGPQGSGTTRAAFTRCTATSNGGGVHAEGEAMSVSDAEFAGCSATNNGGGINCSATGTASVSGCTFGDSSYTADGQPAVAHCQARNGGGAAFGGAACEVTVSGSAFTDCKATSGSGGGIYSTAKTLTVQGPQGSGTTRAAFTRCTATSNGGGVHAEGEAMSVSDAAFAGCSANNSGGGINCSATGTASVSGCTFGDSSYTADGQPAVAHCQARNGGGAAFSGAACVATVSGSTFTNCAAVSGGSGGGIYSAASNLTTQNFGNDQTAFVGCTAVNGGGGAYVQGGFEIKDGTSFTDCNAGQGGAICANGANAQVTITGGTISGNRATARDAGGGAIRVIDGAGVTISGGTITGNYVKYPGGGAACGGAISVNGGQVTISGGTINNNYVETQTDGGDKEALGGAIYVSAGTLIINGGTIGGTDGGNYAKATTNGALGGAILLTGSNATGTISGGTISGNYAWSTKKDAYGGAVAVRNGATLTMNGGEISGNYSRADTKINKVERDAYGGAVAIVDNGVMALSGGTISGNYVTHTASAANAMGAGVYVGYGNTDKTKTGTEAIKPGTLNIYGNPSFGGTGVDENGSIIAADSDGKTIGNLLVSGLPSGSTNGGSTYANARQDIYLAGYEGADAASINVTGVLSGENGSIWVWAEKAPHYKKDEQFANINLASGAAGFGNLAVFRDARADADSNAPLGGLYGKQSTTNVAHVIWGVLAQEAAYKVILKKIDGSTNAPIDSSNGAPTFAIYRNENVNAGLASSVTVDAGGNIGQGVELTGMTSDATGVFFVGMMLEGTYFMVETGVPAGYDAGSENNERVCFYWLTVDENGARIQGPYTDRVAYASVNQPTP